MNHFSIGLWHATKSGFYTTGHDLLSGWTKKKVQSTSQSQTCTKKRSCSLVFCCWSDPPSVKPLQLSMLSKSMRCTKNCNAYKLASVNRKGPIFLHNNAQLHVAQPTLQKLNELGCEVLPHPPYSLDLLPTDYHFFKHLDNFLQGKRFYNQQDAENAFQQFIESWSTDFYTTGTNKLISCWQKYVDYNGSYFN